MKSVYCIKYSRCNILKEFQHQMNIDIFAYVIDIFAQNTNLLITMNNEHSFTQTNRYNQIN